MNYALIGLVVVLILVALYVIITYNSFKSLQVKIKASVQEIGNQLKRQASLIPNLEESVKGYAKHEKSIYSDITSARQSINSSLSQTNAKNLDGLETSLTSLISGLRVVIESNPELKANQNFDSLMNQLTETADKVMYSRRLLIDLAATYNQKLMTFPSNLVAKIFGFKEEKGLDTPASGEHIEVSTQDTADPQVKFD